MQGRPVPGCGCAGSVHHQSRGGQGQHCYKQEETERPTKYTSLLKTRLGVKDKARFGLSFPSVMLCQVWQKWKRIMRKELEDKGSSIKNSWIQKGKVVKSDLV